MGIYAIFISIEFHTCCLKKNSKIACKASQYFNLSNLKKITSSTKRKWVVLTSAKKFIPDKIPSLLALKTILLNPSIIRRNNKGDNEQPFLKPLELLKKVVGEPFIKTAKFAVET